MIWKAHTVRGHRRTCGRMRYHAARCERAPPLKGEFPLTTVTARTTNDLSFHHRHTRKHWRDLRAERQGYCANIVQRHYRGQTSIRYTDTRRATTRQRYDCYGGTARYQKLANAGGLVESRYRRDLRRRFASKVLRNIHDRFSDLRRLCNPLARRLTQRTDGYRRHHPLCCRNSHGKWLVAILLA